MSDIPLVRERLLDLSERLKATDPAAARELASLIPLLWRQPMARRRAPVKSAKMTPQKALAIVAYAAANPEKSNQEIGEVFRVNPGRVSEALQRHRGRYRRKAS